jgi:hypothetical protein
VKPVWEVVPSNMGYVDENGVFTASLVTGTAAIIAHYGNKKEYATVQIVAPLTKSTPDEIK